MSSSIEINSKNISTFSSFRAYIRCLFVCVSFRRFPGEFGVAFSQTLLHSLKCLCFSVCGMCDSSMRESTELNRRRFFSFSSSHFKSDWANTGKLNESKIRLGCSASFWVETPKIYTHQPNILEAWRDTHSIGKQTHTHTRILSIGIAHLLLLSTTKHRHIRFHDGFWLFIFMCSLLISNSHSSAQPRHSTPVPLQIMFSRGALVRILSWHLLCSLNSIVCAHCVYSFWQAIHGPTQETSTYTHTHQPKNAILISLISDLIPPWENRFKWISLFPFAALLPSFSNSPLPVIVDTNKHAHGRIKRPPISSPKSDSWMIPYNSTKMRLSPHAIFTIIFGLEFFSCIIHC